MSRKFLIIEPAGGLGNRLIALSSTMALAKNCDIEKITILWRNSTECGCNFEDVIAGLPVKYRVRNVFFIRESYKELIADKAYVKAILKFFQITNFKMLKLILKRKSIKVNGFYDEDAQHELAAYVASDNTRIVHIESCYTFFGELDLSSFIFNQEIVSRFNEFVEKIGRYDAMHIRRTDHVDAIKASPTSLFVKKAEEIVSQNEKAKIYVATDDANVLAEIRGRFPQNIISEADNEVSRLTSTGIRFALYEMLILSRADTLYASQGSTFSLVANSIGNNKMIVLSKQ